jgi:hypothetical protein
MTREEKVKVLRILCDSEEIFQKEAFEWEHVYGEYAEKMSRHFKRQKAEARALAELLEDEIRKTVISSPEQEE